MTSLEKLKRKFIGAMVCVFDNDNQSHEFNVVAVVESNDNTYLGLLPKEDSDEGALIMRYVIDEEVIKQGIAEHPELAASGAIPFTAEVITDDELIAVQPLFQNYDFEADHEFLTAQFKLEQAQLDDVG